MKTKLITGRYKGYEVCYANKGQIFPRDGWYLTKGDDVIYDVIYIEDAIAKTREETIKEEIAYWTDVFDNRPKDRDLESDNIAQNFARIEIERLENKLKK